jgi:hypothetical protein
MIESKVLCKSYNTLRGYKIAMGKYKKDMQKELTYIQDHIKETLSRRNNKGVVMYMGESAYKYENIYRRELEDIELEIRKINRNHE